MSSLLRRRLPLDLRQQSTVKSQAGACLRKRPTRASGCLVDVGASHQTRAARDKHFSLLVVATRQVLHCRHQAGSVTRTPALQELVIELRHERRQASRPLLGGFPVLTLLVGEAPASDFSSVRPSGVDVSRCSLPWSCFLLVISVAPSPCEGSQVTPLVPTSSRARVRIRPY